MTAVQAIAPDPRPDVPVMAGGFRVWCWHGCGWWREAPMAGLDKIMVDRERHVTENHPEPVNR